MLSTLSMATDLATLQKMAEHWSQLHVFGVALFDDQLRYLSVNEKLAAFNGHPRDAHIGNGVHAMAPHWVANLVQPWLEEAAASGQPSLGRRLEGGEVRALLDIVPVAGGLLLIVVDDSPLRQAEQALLARLRLSEFRGSFDLYPHARLGA